MIYNFAKYMFGLGAIGSIDRVAFWTGITAIITFVIALIAWRQLRKINATTRADFNHRFTESFFNENSRNLRMLLKYKLLTFEIEKVDGEDFGYFKLNEEKLESAPIAKKEKENLRSKEIYIDDEIDDEVLGYFEDIGNYEKKGLLDFELIDTGFGYYIKQIWENNEIQEYIKWLRDGDSVEDADEETYKGFEYIYDKVKSYDETEKNKESIWLWRIKWEFFMKYYLYDCLVSLLGKKNKTVKGDNMSVSDDKHYDFITRRLEYANKKIIQTFELFIKLFVILTGGIIWLKTQNFGNDFPKTLITPVRCLISLLGLGAIAIMIPNLLSWWGYRKAQARLRPTDVPPPRHRSYIHEIILMFIIILLTIGAYSSIGSILNCSK